MELFDRPAKGGERALLVHVNLGLPSDEDDLNEFIELVKGAGVHMIGIETTSRKSPEIKYFIGSGKADEVHNYVVAHEVDLVLFNHELTPAQQRNLERLFECRVLDRTGLILDIFAQRARTHEGKLQVELAQLQHLSTRLIRGWTHLERQKGGIGLRGPGETQLETDRRLIGGRIKALKKRLERVQTQREQSRKSRSRHDVPTVSLVGYTNAGKSTLFNAITNADIYAADQLFATLDPTLRKVSLTAQTDVVLADTVGFIKKLPHDLVAAFRSTLQETIEADLLLHVVDAGDSMRAAKKLEVEAVLKQIGAQETPVVLVYNKIDVAETLQPKIKRDDEGRITRVYLSAKSGDGLNLLIDTLIEIFHTELVKFTAVLPPTEARLRGALYDYEAVVHEHFDEKGDSVLALELPEVDYGRLIKAEPNLTHFICDLDGALSANEDLDYAF